MMVRINEETWVNVQEIEVISINVLAGTATLRLRNGLGHTIHCTENFSIAETVERLVDKINHCKEAMHGHSQD